MGGTICKAKSEGQVGRALLWLPWIIVNRVIASVDSAEAKLGRPPQPIEIFVELNKTYYTPMKNVYEVAAVLTSILREDMLYTNDVGSHFTTKQQEGFLLYSENFKNKFGDKYGLDNCQRVMATKARTVNFKQLMTVLKSKDEALFTENQWMFDGEFRFLDGGDLNNEKIAFNTFPRSGNSFLRRLVEQATGITTGATVHTHTSTSLQSMGLKGEYIIDDRCWVIKAHHPALMPMVKQFDSSKVICCVRNPLDVLVSFATLANTMSHSAVPEFNYAKDYPEWWNWWLRLQIDNHVKYFETMLRHCLKENKNPIYIVRYEDLVKDQTGEMNGLMKFLLDTDDLTGTNAERRLQQMKEMGGKASQSYKLKASTGKFNVNASMYNEEQLQYIKDKFSKYLYYFGYASHPTEENPTAFFQFKEHSAENLNEYYGFRKDNERMIAKVTKDQGYHGPRYKVNTDEAFDLLPANMIGRVQEPSIDWAEHALGYKKRVDPNSEGEQIKKLIFG